MNPSFTAHHHLAWTPGRWGKGFIVGPGCAHTPEGTIVTWNVTGERNFERDEYSPDPDGDPAHWVVAEDYPGVRENDGPEDDPSERGGWWYTWNHCFVLSPEGYVYFRCEPGDDMEDYDHPLPPCRWAEEAVLFCIPHAHRSDHARPSHSLGHANQLTLNIDR